MDKQEKHPRKPGAAEFHFRIDAFTPATIPMARLAEYMGQLAAILGEPSSVHFVKLKRGSTNIVHRIEYEAVPKVRSRALAVRAGDAPRDALRAYDNINKMLRDDNGTAALLDRTYDYAPNVLPDAAVIIPFPGVQKAEETFSGIRERGTIDGEVIRVGGPNKWVPVLIQAGGEAVSGCWADRATAKRLALRIFEHVRLHGTGRWDRAADGKWALDKFIIESFEPLSGEALSEALDRIRAIDAFKDTTSDDLDFLRNGPPESENGRH